MSSRIERTTKHTTKRQASLSWCVRYQGQVHQDTTMNALPASIPSFINLEAGT